ncbi:MAG: bifunctional nuclease family protein [Sedimentisphaerales bacterium]|nr:bifunctional nuclease family protein [Sedimentisphaerales bacterium]
MDIEVELSRIIIDEASDQQVIVLKEKGGERSLPIVIGIVEIMAIDRRLKGKRALRPLTHDLLGNVIDAVGAKIEKVVISDLQNHTYYATIHLSIDGKKVEVDSRPSDAIAVGIATNVPFFAAEEVLDNA